MRKNAGIRRPSKNIKKRRGSTHKVGRKRTKRFSLFLYGIGILAVIILFLFLFDGGFLKQTKQVAIKLEDRCGIMFDTIIHHIKSENNCESLCKNECNSQELNFIKVEFQKNETSCNSCTCYCK